MFAIISAYGRTSPDINKTIHYYHSSPGYLDGPLGGACHFGYSKPDGQFDLLQALRAMEHILGETIGLPFDSVVLDAGTGYGRVASTLAEEFKYKIIGVDLILERLTEANRHTGEENTSERVALICGNYCALPIPAGYVDAVFTMETLVHADPLEQALRQFFRVLKPGGKLVLFEYSVPDRATMDPVRRILNDIIIRRTGMASIGRFVRGAFPEILEQAGFENISVTDIREYVWPTWKWLYDFALQQHWFDILTGRVLWKTNLAASLLIWPHRHLLGYNIVTAQKPV